MYLVFFRRHSENTPRISLASMLTRHSPQLSESCLKNGVQPLQLLPENRPETLILDLLVPKLELGNEYNDQSECYAAHPAKINSANLNI